MLRMVESLRPLRNDLYTERHSVVTLPIPYINDYAYIVTGTSLSIPEIEYLRLVDADDTGIYEWYLYQQGDTNKVLFGVFHTLTDQPTLLLNKVGISEFITKHGADEIAPYEPSYPIKSRHILDYYLSSISEEYANVVLEHDYGRDLSKFPKYILNTESTQSILTHFHSVSDNYHEIMKWFDGTNTYMYTLPHIKQMLGTVQGTIMQTPYTSTLYDLYDYVGKWCASNTYKTPNILYHYLEEGYIDRSELRKLSNRFDRKLHRRYTSHTSDHFKQYLPMDDVELPYSFIVQLALSPVREFVVIVDENGESEVLSCTDLYGYSSTILDSYFSQICARIRRMNLGVKTVSYKTWDNQFIMTIGDGRIGNIVIDLTSELIAGVELVHMY